MFFGQEFLNGIDGVFGLWRFFWSHVHLFGEVPLINSIPLVDECNWDFHILFIWINCMRCLVEDMLIRFFMV